MFPPITCRFMVTDCRRVTFKGTELSHRRPDNRVRFQKLGRDRAESTSLLRGADSARPRQMLSKGGQMLARWTLALTIAATCGGTAMAQPKADGRAGLVQKLADCRRITDDKARLSCYDETAAAFDQAEAKGDIVVVDREQARTVRRQAFGFSMPSITLFEKGEAKEELENVTAVLASARRDGAGHWVFKLEDGAVWAQVATEDLFKTPKPGMKVKIKKASLGSFMLQIENQSAIRVRRVE
jgi:hypothetical protein